MPLPRQEPLKMVSLPLKVGDKIPNFKLPGTKDGMVSCDQLLEEGPLILTFYRGSWCPYCNLQLRAFEGYFSQIKAMGSQLVAITPQVPDDSLSEGEISAMEFMVLSDQGAKVAEQFGVAWQVPEFVLNHMKVDRGLDLESINNGNGTILPIPATYVIDQQGVIVWRYLDVDYRTRAEPSEVVQKLKEIA